ncbi:SRPBCC domain-containing protein [Paraburkholderia sp. FT54]|uniref:SRPBCC family protein n=1 Tax=Paraburkholderia sp. FT54 TaxID=3074437 RepID=UPI002877ED6A|nr:SRPBCC domain-containing protein [Paraburkholderia sp. FT54]WNC88507.1 SRPBCC domain-containing protein [Paraburkholderia sp. FT54]
MTWMHPGGADVVRAELDVRVDGRYAIVYRKPDGNEVEVNGRYLEVVPERKLVFTWVWRYSPEHESQVTLLLEPDGDGTWLTLTHERLADDAQCEDHRRGWTDGIDSLERYVA